MATSSIDLVLYVRRWCHLCEDMEVALEALRPSLPFELRKIDIDEHPEFEDRYGELVPVLESEGRVICHYHLDELRLRACAQALG